MEIAFCSDRKMLAALHVAARTILKNFVGTPKFSVLTDDLEETDFELLRETLDSLGKEYVLQSFQLDTKQFDGFPKLAGSYSTYFRLMIPDILESQNCFYVDSDTLCLCDISSLLSFDLQESPLALVPEALIQNSVDLQVFKMLSADAKGPYFNAGVSLINCKKWLSEGIKDSCINFIGKHQPKYWDQSALNFVLHGRIAVLPGKFNFLTNVRANWPTLRSPNYGKGCLLHFVDYPKPWSAMGRWVHPFGNQWWGEYQKTAHFRKNPHTPAPVQWDSKTRFGYHKALKDRLLFSLYGHGLILPKGVPAS
jgi:lipopolysaccharide biosynthesis glycosyltransferase